MRSNVNGRLQPWRDRVLHIEKKWNACVLTAKKLSRHAFVWIVKWWTCNSKVPDCRRSWKQIRLMPKNRIHELLQNRQPYVLDYKPQNNDFSRCKMS
mmetsp:Transcript_68808/g.95673  ORF Transcript_68808/g.95673 Transcript_68808/m.95673 type:complete len:97 (+) Transcript_68808:196-486(+)